LKFKAKFGRPVGQGKNEGNGGHRLYPQARKEGGTYGESEAD
jgi:hypothetical protein